MSPAITPALVSQIREEAGAYFRSARGSHDWDHTERVTKLSMKIGRKEKADLGVLKLAAILHDIGREEEDRSHGRICHGRSGATLAKKILERHGCDPVTIRAVAEAIRTHRFRRGGAPKTLEARILFDADKLDSIGAVGVGRAFLFAGEIGARLHDKAIDISKTKPYTREDTAYREYLVKLSRVRDRMTTREGRRMAAERHRFMAAFFDRLNKETDGVL
ncbi:MAG: HD domain-containing protein [Candidatus Aminicenantales bacterium]